MSAHAPQSAPGSDSRSQSTPRPGRVRRGELPSHRRAWFTWNPGLDTAMAALTVALISLAYYLGAGRGIEGILFVGILIAATVLPAYTVFGLMRDGRWADLGITRRWLTTSLIISIVLGAGSLFQLLTEANKAGVDPVPHALTNLAVFWEPFLLAFLYLRWEKAFGIVAAVLLVGVGFVIQHLGSVPLPTAMFFGITATVFIAIFATTRNLFVLWPFFYSISSGIGTLQAGFPFGWDQVGPQAATTVAQFGIIVGIWWWFRGRPARRPEADSATALTKAKAPRQRHP